MARDPFNPICFSQDSEKYIEEESNSCILTSYKHNQDFLELEEKELTLFQDEIQQTSNVLTLQNHWTEISANLNKNKVFIKAGDVTGVLLRLDDFIFYEWRGKTYEKNWPSTWKLKYVRNFGEQSRYFWGSREHAVEFMGTGELKKRGFKGTS